MIVQGTEWIEGEFACRVMQFLKAGDMCLGHAHYFPHLSNVNRGGIILRKLAEDPAGTIRCTLERFDALTGRPVVTEVMCSVESERRIHSTDVINWVTIPAGTFHQIEATEDNSQCVCLFAHRDHRGHIIDKYQGNRDATL